MPIAVCEKFAMAAGARRLDIRDESGKRQRNLHRAGDEGEVAGQGVTFGEISTGSSHQSNETLLSRAQESSDEETRANNHHHAAPPRRSSSSEARGGDATGRSPQNDVYAAGLNIDTIAEFKKDYVCLHPDYPCNVASPLQINDAGIVQPMVFYPSLSTAFVALMWDIDRDVAGERSKPWSHGEAEKWCKQKHNEVKDLIRLHRDKSVRKLEGFVQFIA